MAVSQLVVSSNRETVAGLLNWNFAEIDVLWYEQRSGELRTAKMKVDIVLRQPDQGALKQHLVLHSSRLTDWNVFNNVVHETRTTPMEVGVLGKVARTARASTTRTRRTIP